MGRILNSQTNDVSSEIPTQNQVVGRIFKAQQLNPPKPSITSKVLNFGKELAAGIVKPFAQVATNVVNVGQIALGKPETKPFSGSFLGDVEGLGKVDITKSPFAPENLKTIKKSTGVGLEIGSLIAPYGGITKATAVPIMEKLVPIIGRKSAIKAGGLAGEAISGGLGMGSYSAGASMEADLSPAEIAKQTAIGTGLGLATGGLLYGAGRILRKGVALEPEVKYNKLDTTIKKPIKPTEVETLVPKTSKVKQIEEINPIIKTPEAQKEIQKIYEQAKAEAPDEVIFESTTKPERFERIASQSEEHINNVLNGTEKPLQGTTIFDYEKVASRMSDKTDDIQKAIDLATNPLLKVEKSKAGQELGAIAGLDKQSTTYILRDIIESNEQKLPGRILSSKNTELNSIKSKVEELFNTVKDMKQYTKEDFINAIKGLDDVICP